MSSAAPNPSYATTTTTDQPQAAQVPPSATRRTSRPSAQLLNTAGPSDATGSSRSRLSSNAGKMQQSSARMDQSGPRERSYTRTGRISKARKGVKDAHRCSCGKSYSRAEHLRRHTLNHDKILYCSFQNCDKIFHRDDLLRRHERNHETSTAMETLLSRSPSVAYTTTSAMDVPMSATISLNATPAFSPIPTPATMTSLPATPFTDTSGAMSAPSTNAMPMTGLGLSSVPALSIPAQAVMDPSTMSIPEGNLSASSSSFSTAPYDTPWPAYSNAYLPTQTPIITSNESWPQAAAIHGSLLSPTSVSATPHTYWYPNDKGFAGVDTSLSMSYPLDLQTMLPTAPETASPYVPYATAQGEWDHSSSQSMTPITIKAELSSPITLHDNQPLSATLGLYAKQSYYDAYWEYMHPLYPILHKPTMEQQRHLGGQQSSSDMLLQAAIVICGAPHSNEESRWVDGRRLLKKALQHIEQEHLSLPHDLQAMQALFLIEAYAQYYGQRAPAQLSRYFNSIVNQLQNDAEVRGAAAWPMRVASPPSDEPMTYQWSQWIVNHSKQRLLLACTVLMAQTTLYLRQDGSESRLSWQGLAMPCSTTSWGATSAAECRSLLLTELPVRNVEDALVNLTNFPPQCLDPFQSMVLVAAHTTTQSSNPRVAEALRLAASQSSAVQLHLHASLLAQDVPLRALLAVAGESWTPAGGRLATHARAAADLLGRMKTTLRTWVSQRFAPLGSESASSSRLASNAPQTMTTNVMHSSLSYALTTLRIASGLEAQAQPLPFAGEIAIYISTLVLWAIGHEAMGRCVSSRYTTLTPPTSGSSDFTSAGVRQGLTAFINAAETGGLLARICSGGADLGTASQWRQGVDATMRWTRLRLGGFSPSVPPNIGRLAPPSPAAAARPRSHSMPQIQAQPQPQHQQHFPHQSQLGELNAGFINVLRRLEVRGWAGAWF